MKCRNVRLIFWWLSLMFCLSEIILCKHSGSMKKNVKFMFYNGQDVGKYVILPLEHAENLINQTNFHLDRPTMFYVGGWTEKLTARTTSAIIKSYLQAAHTNIIQVDWTSNSNKNFQGAIHNSVKVGKVIAKAIEKIIGAGVRRDSIQLIGHSLGGQLIGSIGRNMRQPVGLLVALDAIGPGFAIWKNHFSFHDGTFTINILTDRGVYGSLNTDAHLNVYFNRGIRPQPGCPVNSNNDHCHHELSVFFWASIISNPGAFIARKCEIFTEGLKCYENMTTTIGPETRVSGKYFLVTKPEPPFFLGMKGAKYKKNCHTKKLPSKSHRREIHHNIRVNYNS